MRSDSACRSTGFRRHPKARPEPRADLSIPADPGIIRTVRRPALVRHLRRPPGVDQDQWDQAMQACQSLAPQPPGGLGGPPR
ncbi:hypothetical protein ATO49_04960 [Mycolicibacterium fortuitum subsp. fortuitum DSM 46621 = ATCC 6841 = JCM 6387]|nr:hypothetical protein ATO49_04960 [Mycolicibacterium fortuitum subsp. fortuitum DSM 46621 = ATCC 6841 = JCM 6387]